LKGEREGERGVRRVNYCNKHRLDQRKSGGIISTLESRHLKTQTT